MSEYLANKAAFEEAKLKQEEEKLSARPGGYGDGEEGEKVLPRWRRSRQNSNALPLLLHICRATSAPLPLLLRLCPAIYAFFYLCLLCASTIECRLPWRRRQAGRIMRSAMELGSHHCVRTRMGPHLKIGFWLAPAVRKRFGDCVSVSQAWCATG